MKKSTKIILGIIGAAVLGGVCYLAFTHHDCNHDGFNDSEEGNEDLGFGAECKPKINKAFRLEEARYVHGSHFAKFDGSEKLPKIDKVFRTKEGRYVHGTHFVKGDYIETNVKYWVRLDDHRTVEVDRGTVKDLIGGDPQRISGKMLDSLKGKTYNG